MDPVLGVFLSVDPVTAYSDPVGHFNPYRYANSNPYKYIDPDGRCPGGPQTGTRICGGGAGNNVSTIQVNPSSGREGEKTVNSFKDLPKLPEREVSADGKRSAGETWERQERFTGKQEIKWNNVSENQWKLLPTSIITAPLKINPLSKLFIPDIRYAKQIGFNALEYQVGYKHVFQSYSGGVYHPSSEIYGGHGTIWTSERYWKLDISPRGEVGRVIYDIDL